MPISLSCLALLVLTSGTLLAAGAPASVPPTRHSQP